MARYLFQASYTSESWKYQIHTRSDVIERIEPVVTACNGTLDALYYAFGDYDVVAILDFAKAEDAAAFSIAATAGGALKSAQTTALMTVEQGQAAMKRAESAASAYQPPVTIDLVGKQKAPSR